MNAPDLKPASSIARRDAAYDFAEHAVRTKYEDIPADAVEVCKKEIAARAADAPAQGSGWNCRPGCLAECATEPGAGQFEGEGGQGGRCTTAGRDRRSAQTVLRDFVWGDRSRKLRSGLPIILKGVPPADLIIATTNRASPSRMFPFWSTCCSRRGRKCSPSTLPMKSGWKPIPIPRPARTKPFPECLWSACSLSHRLLRVVP